MDDREIILLYEKRDERAIAQTIDKYSAYCRTIASGILSSPQDVEECLNDVWNRVWDHIPPQKPTNLRIWIGRIVRNLALNYHARNRAQKRDSGMCILLSELEDCLPSPDTAQKALEGQELTAFLNRWLETLPREDRILFLRRYWNGEPLKQLEAEYARSHGSLAKRMYTLRLNLKQALEKEGYTI